MNGIDIKNDFDSIFLAEAGETFDHVRNDTKLGSLRGIREAPLYNAPLMKIYK